MVNANGIGLKITALANSSLVGRQFLEMPLSMSYVGGISGEPIEYRVRVNLKSPVTAHTPEGVYTDTMHFDVNY